MKLAPSLHRIGSDLVAVYLVEDVTGVTIVDAGLPGQWDELEPELGLMGRSLEDVRGVILTHGDTDHIGFAERLRRERGVPILVHELDATRGPGRGEEGDFVGQGQSRPVVALPLLQRTTWRSQDHAGLRSGRLRRR